MKIAVLTSGRLPVPAVSGGAVETLIDFYLEYNQQNQLHDINIFSINDVLIDKANISAYNHYHYIDTTSWHAKIQCKIFSYIHKSSYYHYRIEYFLHQTLKQIAKKNYDLIILENRPGYAISIAKITNTPIILHLHNDLLNSETHYASQIYKSCTAIIAVSDFIKKKVDSIQSTVPTITIHNGIDINKFHYPQLHIRKQDLGFKENDFIILYSGRIIKEKGIQELIQAFKNLKDYSNLKLLIIGGSFYGEGLPQDEFTLNLKKEVKQNDLSITFTGFIPYTLIPSYLALADICVIPSMWEEPFGLTCIEAMSAGLPIIATNSGAIPEIAKDVAFFIHKDNVVSNLSQAILYLYNNPDIRKKLSFASKEKSFIYSKENYAEQFFKTLQSIHQSYNSRPFAK